MAQVVMMEMANPWNIQSIYDLQYFNCPSCTFKNRSKQGIVNHAYQFHPESVNFLSNLSDNSLDDVMCPWKDHFIEIEDAGEFYTKNYISDRSDQKFMAIIIFLSIL